MTINLLPPNNRVALRAGFVFASIQSLLIAFLVLSAFAAGTLMAVRMLIAGTYQDLAARTTTSSDEFTQFTTEIRDINAYLKRADGLTKRVTPWSTVFFEITGMVPPGTRLTRLSVDSRGVITLSGIAAAREDVLLLGDRLKASEKFKDITSPLSNILQQRNVRFDFEMTYLPPAPAPATTP